MRRTSWALVFFSSLITVAYGQYAYSDYSNDYQSYGGGGGLSVVSGYGYSSPYSTTTSVYDGFTSANTSTPTYSGSLSTYTQPSTYTYQPSTTSTLSSNIITSTSTTTASASWTPTTTTATTTSTMDTTYSSGIMTYLLASGMSAEQVQAMYSAMYAQIGPTTGSISTSPSSINTISTVGMSDNPEPATVLLTGGGLLTALLVRRRLKKA